MKITFPSVAYDEFYQRLESKLRKRIGAAGKLKGDSLWEEFAQHEAVADIFGDSTLSRTYFYNKLSELGKDTLTLERELFCNALEFIDYKMPKGAAKGFESRYQHLAGALLKEYFPDNPEYLDYLLPRKKVKKPAPVIPGDVSAVKNASGLIADLAMPRFRSLDNAYFTLESVQGEMKDYSVLHLRIALPDQVEGEVTILYQQEDNSYLQPVKLKVRGYFLYETMLSLLYENADPTRKHAGVMLLNYNSALELVGHFMPFHDPLLPERQGKVAWEIKLSKATQTAANEFLKQKSQAINSNKKK